MLYGRRMPGRRRRPIKGAAGAVWPCRGTRDDGGWVSGRRRRHRHRGMAEGGEHIILEDFLLVEDALLLEEMAEEDDELDLYNEMTFGLDRDSTEEDVPKLLVVPEISPDVAKALVEATGRAAEQLEELAEDEGGVGPEVEQVNSQLEEEVEELGTEEQEDDQECFEEPSGLGDPAVMRAVRSKPPLESQDSAVLDSRIGTCWGEFGKEDMATMDSTAWGSCSGNVPRHLMLEDKAILQVLERPPPSPNMTLNFLGSPAQRACGSSPQLKCPDLRLVSPKPFSQCFLQQGPLMSPRSPCTPRPFPPACRPPPLFAPNQTAGYAPPTPFQPGSPTVGSPPGPLGMYFGPMSSSVDPALFFSPSAMGQLNFSTPSHMTQLHPQHQRILMQQQGKQAQSVSPKKLWSRKADPYAGLMTSKEKDWVVKVQMMQLQSENMDDDYYYQTYYHQLERKQAEEELLGRRNKPPKLVTPFIQKVETYDSVVRIAGSLGQVTVSTCYSPRRAIDAVHHALVEEEAAGTHRLRALHRIEKLFLQLLEVEEVQQKMSMALREQQPHREEKKTQKVESIYQALKIRACSSEEEAEDEFLQLLCVRKGKKLMARLLPHLIREQREKILLTITHHLPFLMKKDMLDESLPLLYSPLNEVVGEMTFNRLIEVLQELTRPLPESSELPLTMALKNQFGISLLYSLLSHGERLLSSRVPLKPCRGDFEAWTDTVYLMSQELSRLPTTSLAEPLFLPSNLVLLFCRYLDKQTVYHLAAKMTECSPLPTEADLFC
ncbi:LOW QUALITY PROTEIN: protein PAT1 homolog 2 [Catharus ustulatus]|uniref:LOW QUALITY PROTEIN: protein PAT1 homolog 2 n=1 Tax=Catharus ustulatus TaxID=91951 RepID=UPI00140C8B91|nr:LOW QUALITY PROTEIN: protein PAT1 homolog 2 [Catharus ustulatus]